MNSFAANEAVEILNPSGSGQYVIVCEHASNFIPEDLDDLGLLVPQLASHIAWDAGALGVARILSNELDAPLVAAKTSRLVYDCNRAPGVKSAVVEESDGIIISGNVGITDEDRLARENRIYQPFATSLRDCLAHRDANGQTSTIVTVHSFTPILNGVKRYLDLGVLHDTDRRLADQIMAIAHLDGTLRVRRNEPYSAEDDVTHTLVEHGIAKGRLNVMLEIRNDLLPDVSAQAQIGKQLSDWILQAHNKLLVG